MSTNGFSFFPSAAAAEAHNFGRNWGWFLVLGVLLIITGAVAIAYPVMATMTTIAVFGYLLVAGGIIEVASSFWAGGWGGFFLHLIGGLLYLFVGIVMIDQPIANAAVLTILLAMFFVAIGLVRTVFALTHHFHGWGWAVLSGIVTFILGVMIWRQWPGSTFWVIGTFVGIDLIFNGFSWIMVGAGLRAIHSAIKDSAGRPAVV
jgi:uncharacterized membrane protein HdeD (DUF308 family)